LLKKIVSGSLSAHAPIAGRGLLAMTMSVCLSVCLSVANVDDTIRYLDSKAECDQLNLAHETKTNKRQCPLSSVDDLIVDWTKWTLAYSADGAAVS